MPISTKIEENIKNKKDNIISFNEEKCNKEYCAKIEKSNSNIFDSGGKSELKIIKNINNRESIDISNNIYSEENCLK